ncbi:MAG TPA: class E sortase [Egibacteraceae bacterium]|nr:class E sortase [Egibacteraceae bacterium]
MPDPLASQAGRAQGAVAYAMDALRLRPASRRALSVLAVVLSLAGAGMFAYPLFTDVYASEVLQDQLEDRYASEGFKQRYVTRTVRHGDPLTRIVIPSLGVSAVVVEGTSAAALRAGAGHYPNTPLPGEAGNVAIAGHRTTYGKPFNRIDELAVGARIRLETPLATYTYRVVGHPDDAAQPCPNGACWITHPGDWGVVSPTPGRMLTLTTCHPKGSAAQRLIVRAQLTSTTPPRSRTS